MNLEKEKTYHKCFILFLSAKLGNNNLGIAKSDDISLAYHYAKRQ